MSIGKQSVGEFLYVFSKNDGNKANSTCVIDCHGEQFLFGNTRGVEFAVRSGVSLYFYVQHNDPLNFDIHDMTHGKSYGDDPDDYIFSSTLKEISTGSRPAVETVTGGNTSKDYKLTKIQGKTTKLKSILASERNEMTYEDVEKFMKFNNMSMDIVTVRHRPKLETISLSKAIDLLWTKGYEYSDIHCCFCRNTFLSSIKS